MSSLEAKIVVVGSQGVGKTSLVTRYCKGAFDPAQVTSTVGASFLTKRVIDTDTDTVVRLQIWDTAGQERFRSISRLYYRGANACILCYSITDANSFAEMGIWLTELRRNLPADIVLHVVGTKADIVARDPSQRQVPFERCIAYVAENLAPGLHSTPPPTASAGPASISAASMLGGAAHGPASAMLPPPLPLSAAAASPFHTAAAAAEPRSPSSKRSSGFWGQEAGWDACHEISAESGEGVEEVFRVVARKLVEQDRRMQQVMLAAISTPSGNGMWMPGSGPAYGGDYSVSGSGAVRADGYSLPYGAHMRADDHAHPQGSFRLGRDRRSWLFPAGFGPDISADPNGVAGVGPADQAAVQNRRRGCC